MNRFPSLQSLATYRPYRAFNPVPRNNADIVYLSDSKLFPHLLRRHKWESTGEQSRKQSSFHSLRNVVSSPRALFAHPVTFRRIIFDEQGEMIRGKFTGKVFGKRIEWIETLVQWDERCPECNGGMKRGKLMQFVTKESKKGNPLRFGIVQSFSCLSCSYGFSTFRDVGKK